MGTRPYMWPASASIWTVPAACWKGSQKQAEDHFILWTYSYKTGKVGPPRGERGDTRQKTHPQGREGHDLAMVIVLSSSVLSK